jgi:membrane protease YdiL (CAAX protease family)
MLGLAIAAWLLGFVILRDHGTWIPFGFMGPALAALALWSDAPTRGLLRPSFAQTGVGIAAGLLMVALTHAAYALAAPLLGAASAETIRLYELFRMSEVPSAARAALLVLIASSEEVLFRGALLDRPAGLVQEGRLRRRGDLPRVLASAAGYTLAMSSLGSGLLMVCAFGCAVLWGGLRVATRSLVAPIIAHVVWDLGVLVVWPLARPG